MRSLSILLAILILVLGFGVLVIYQHEKIPVPIIVTRVTADGREYQDEHRLVPRSELGKLRAWADGQENVVAVRWCELWPLPGDQGDEPPVRYEQSTCHRL